MKKRELKQYAKKLAGGCIHASLGEGWPYTLDDYDVDPWIELSDAEKQTVFEEIENIAYRLTEQ